MKDKRCQHLRHRMGKNNLRRKAATRKQGTQENDYGNIWRKTLGMMREMGENSLVSGPKESLDTK